MGLGIRNALRRRLRTALLGLGYHRGPVTSSGDLRRLMRKLRPMDCGVELIRMGSAHDGGYLIPNDLEGIEYCFSPGVHAISDFENQVADHGIRSFLADYSVDAPAILRPEFTFDRMFLGTADRDHFFTLQTWKDRYLENYSGDLLLQMDIEGAEYEVIQSIPTPLLDQFRIAVIEFHGMDRLFDAFCFRQIASCFDKLLLLFEVVHIHPNNFEGSVKRGNFEIPEVMEFTFLNKRRVKQAKPRTAFPHPLDQENHDAGQPLVLGECWYKEDEDVLGVSNWRKWREAKPDLNCR